MPLIVITGYPCSRKSTRVEELKCFLSETVSNVVVVSDNQFSQFSRTEVYSDTRKEKNLRGFLKSEVQKHLNKDTVVILDSLNYIKGYRYELHCITKSSQTPHCVIWCDINREVAKSFNTAREGDRYSDEVFDQLVMRYEAPNSSSRWDSPLFIVQADDSLPSRSIHDALFKSKAPAPNLSTVAQPLQPTNFMYELDRVTSDIVKNIMSAQKISVIGDKVKVADGAFLVLVKRFTMGELNKVKRQFITYMKMNPVTDVAKLGLMFSQYLQSHCQ